MVSQVRTRVKNLALLCDDEKKLVVDYRSGQTS
jgi:hypothetical protein